MGQPYPTLDYVNDLPPGVPAMERPFSTQGYITPLIPKSRKFHGVLPPGPSLATYYFPITGKSCNPTGVFFPSGFAYPNVIDVILYFHGFKQGKFSYINEYWSGRLMGIRFREDIVSAGKRLVLIAPTLGERPGSATESDMRVFAQAGGGDGFLDEVRRWIGKYVPEYTSRSVTPTISRVVLAGHSGAGLILYNQAFSMTSPIREVWGFDSLYGGESLAVGGWLTLARMRPDVRFFFHWGTSPLRSNATELAGLLEDLRNISIEETPAPSGITTDSNQHHFAVLTENFRVRVRNSALG